MIQLAPAPCPPARPCFTCAHFQGMYGDHLAACGHRGERRSQAVPERGCVYHARNPDEDPLLVTVELWAGKHGRPIPGLTIPWSEEKRLPPPLPPPAIVKLHEAAKALNASMLTAPMARDIGRLHELLYRTVHFLEYVAQWIEAGPKIQADAKRAAEILRAEPGVKLLIEREQARRRRR